MRTAKLLGLVGRKRGMTRVFTETGESVPVTVIEALPNRVSQVKTDENDGYSGIQVACGNRKPANLSKALAGHYAKIKVAPGESLVEFRLIDTEASKFQPGAEIKVDIFKEGQIVDVTGTTTGKGY